MTPNSKYEVVPSFIWQHKGGAAVSIYGAIPWRTEKERADWATKHMGYTVRNPYTGIVGIGKEPWKTQEEAQAFADTHKPPR